MMKESIKLILRGSGDGLSSKRVLMFLFAFAFFGEGIAWYVLKMPPNETIATQLFITLSTLIVAVTGEKAINKIGDKKADASPDNKPAA